MEPHYPMVKDTFFSESIEVAAKTIKRTLKSQHEQMSHPNVLRELCSVKYPTHISLENTCGEEKL